MVDYFPEIEDTKLSPQAEGKGHIFYKKKITIFFKNQALWFYVR